MVTNNITRIVKGVPTAVDVKRLYDRFGVPKVGDVITYAAICDIIGAKYRTHRWSTVVWAWRASLRREHGVELVIHVLGESFVAADAYRKLRKVIGVRKAISRRIRRAIEIHSITDAADLSSTDRPVHELEGLRLAHMLTSSRQRTFAPTLPSGVKRSTDNADEE